MKRALFFLPLFPLTVAGYFLLEDMVTKRRASQHIIMIGDERVMYFPQEKLPITFSGREAETTTTLLSRIAVVAAEKPKKLVLEIGYHDLKNGVSVDSLLDNFRRIIAQVKATSPATRIYIQDILPGPKGDAVNGAAYRFNRSLPALAESEGVAYLPVADLLTPRGYLNPYQMESNRLNDHAYFQWKWRIRRRMNE